MKRTPDEIERIFIAGLDVIKRGDATIDSYLSQYPDLADELRPQLETSLWLLERKEAIQPRPGFLPDSKRRLMAKINASQPESISFWDKFLQVLTRQRLAPVAFVLVMIVFMVANLTIVSLSQNSLPGEPLYRTKRLLEEVTLATTLDNAEVAQLNINFVRRRLDEVESLVIKGRYEEVDQIVNEYEQQVNQTIDTIDQIAAVDTLTAQRLARQLEAILALSRPRLTRLNAGAPSSVASALTKAILISDNGQTAAQILSQGPGQSSTATSPPLPTRTPFQIPTATPTSGSGGSFGPLPTSAPTQAPLPTNTPLPSATNTAKPPTATPAPTNTNPPPPPPTNTPLPTSTNTPTATNTPTPTSTNTPTPTNTNTPTPTPTNTPTPTSTNTPTPTNTNTPTATNTNTPLPTNTNTPLPTNTNTPLPTNTNTPAPTSTLPGPSGDGNTSTPTPANTSAPDGSGSATTTAPTEVSAEPENPAP